MSERNLFLKLLEEKTLLADGAIGTELQKQGFPLGSCLEELNITHPEMVKKIHLDYLNAGSDIIQTNSFGGNRSRLKTHGFSDRVVEFNRRSAELAREICPKIFIGGSIGPTGDIIEPLGELSEEAAYDIFAEQAEALAEGGVDIICIETMSALEEAEIAIHAAKKITGLPVIAEMTFRSSRVGPRTEWGVSVSEAIQKLAEFGADVIGANCGQGFKEMSVIIEKMRAITTKPIIAKPNVGIPEWIDGISIYRQTPEMIISDAKKLIDLGVNILGGCCGTGPAHIKIIRELINVKKT